MLHQFNFSTLRNDAESCKRVTHCQSTSLWPGVTSQGLTFHCLCPKTIWAHCGQARPHVVPPLPWWTKRPTNNSPPASHWAFSPTQSSLSLVTEGFLCHVSWWACRGTEAFSIFWVPAQGPCHKQSKSIHLDCLLPPGTTSYPSGSLGISHSLFPGLL